MIEFTPKYRVAFIGFSLLFMYSIYIEYFRGYVKKNGKNDIGYVDFYSSGVPDSGPSIKYVYVVKNHTYKNMVTTNGKIKYSQKGKYYRIKYLEDDPEKSVLYLNREITDSLKIAKFKEAMLRSRKSEIDALVQKAKDKIYEK